MHLTIRMALTLTLSAAVMFLSATAADRTAGPTESPDRHPDASFVPGMRSGAPHFDKAGERSEFTRAQTPALRSAQHVQASADDCGPYFTMEGPRDTTAYGLIMNSVGDVNQDGFEDVWIPELRWGLHAAGFIYSGSDQSLLHIVESETTAGYLDQAAGADFNGDGYQDLIYSDPYYDGVAPYTGRVYINYGSATGFPATIQATSADVVIDGYSDSSEFGIGVVVLNDIDGDTHPDFAVSANEQRVNGPGHVYVYSGSTQDTLFSIAGDGAGVLFGWDLANPGDVNNDGYDDLLIGAAYGSGPGYALVVSGADGAVLYRLEGEADGDQFSWYGLNGAGDLNQDGYADVIVGAYANVAGGGTQAGRAYVFFGGSGPFPNTINAADADFIVTGAPWSCFGFGVGGLGDVNGDSVPDFAVGAMYYTHSNVGQLHIFSGVDASLMFVLEGLDNLEDFGATCIAPWDLDGDGVKDLLVGAYCQTDYIVGGPARGRVYAYLIGDLDQDGIIAQCDSCQRYATPGNEALTTGDVNMDAVITSGDIIWLVNYVFKGGLAPMPIAEAGEVNHDLVITSADIIYLVNHVFKGGPAPLDACALP